MLRNAGVHNVVWLKPGPWTMPRAYTQNVNVLQEDIQVCPDNGNRQSHEVLVALVAIWTLPRN